MTNAPYKVLYLCTGNSARSIMAEALTNTPSITQGKFEAFSAGSFPTGIVNPYALDLLRRHGISTKGLRSKSWDEFAQAGAAKSNFVITVCDKAAGEQCPYWPGQSMTAHWGVPDPTDFYSSEEQKRKAFFDAYMILRRRIELFASLPLDKLDRLALQERLSDIGKH
jgi:arsenate reductase